MNNKITTFISLLRELKMNELKGTPNKQIVVNCLEEVKTPIRDAIMSMITEGSDFTLYNLMYNALTAASEVLPQDLNDTDATAVVTAIIGNVSKTYNNLPHMACCQHIEIPKEVLDAAMNLGGKTPNIIVLNLSKELAYFKPE